MILRLILACIIMCIVAVTIGSFTKNNEILLWTGTVGLSIFTLIVTIFVITTKQLRGSLPITRRPLDLFLFPSLHRSTKPAEQCNRNEEIHWVGQNMIVPCIFIHPVKDKVTESTTIVIFAHGNAMTMHHMLPYVEETITNINNNRNNKIGNYHAVVFEYPGYGYHRNPSTDDPDSFIQSCVDVITYVRTEKKYTNIILFGHSLGAAVVLGACAQLNNIQSPSDTPWVKGCVTYGAFSSVRDMVAKFLKSHTEAGWFEERFDNCNFLAQISSTPVHLIHGRNDKLIPISQARKLYTHANSNLVRLHETRGGHNDLQDGSIVDCILSI